MCSSDLFLRLDAPHGGGAVNAEIDTVKMDPERRMRPPHLQHDTHQAPRPHGAQTHHRVTPSSSNKPARLSRAREPVDGFEEFPALFGGLGFVS